MEVDNKVTPVVIPPRRVPVAIKVRLKEELDHLESLEVTRREDEPTEWVPLGSCMLCLFKIVSWGKPRLSPAIGPR